MAEITIGDPGDLTAPPGSRAWAVAVRNELLGLIHDSESSAQHLQRFAQAMEANAGFTHLMDATGRTFDTFANFCATPPPFGLGIADLAGMVQDRLAQQMRQRVAAAAEETDGSVLPPGNSADRHVRAKQQQERARKHGISQATQHRLDLLARERPDLLAQVREGTITPFRAAVVAGLETPRVTVVLDPARAAVTLYRKMTRAQLEQLITRLQELLVDGE